MLNKIFTNRIILIVFGFIIISVSLLVFLGCIYDIVYNDNYLGWKSATFVLAGSLAVLVHTIKSIIYLINPKDLVGFEFKWQYMSLAGIFSVVFGIIFVLNSGYSYSNEQSFEKILPSLILIFGVSATYYSIGTNKYLEQDGLLTDKSKKK